MPINVTRNKGEKDCQCNGSQNECRRKRCRSINEFYCQGSSVWEVRKDVPLLTALDGEIRIILEWWRVFSPCMHSVVKNSLSLSPQAYEGFCPLPTWPIGSVPIFPYKPISLFFFLFFSPLANTITRTLSKLRLKPLKKPPPTYCPPTQTHAHVHLHGTDFNSCS